MMSYHVTPLFDKMSDLVDKITHLVDKIKHLVHKMVYHASCIMHHASWYMYVFLAGNIIRDRDLRYKMQDARPKVGKV